MSTRSAIIAKTDSGFAGIYCHFDGYLEHNGKILHENYQDPQKVAQLIALGDISSLRELVEPPFGVTHTFDNPQPDVTTAYIRDRGEVGCEAQTGATPIEVANKIGHNGHVYVFDGGWTHNGVPLAEALAAEERP